MSDKVEKFRSEHWTSIWGLHLDLGPMLPMGVKPPDTQDLIQLANRGLFPARRTANGGYIIHKHDLPKVVSAILKIRGIKQ